MQVFICYNLLWPLNLHESCAVVPPSFVAPTSWLKHFFSSNFTKHGLFRKKKGKINSQLKTLVYLKRDNHQMTHCSQQWVSIIWSVGSEISILASFYEKPAKWDKENVSVFHKHLKLSSKHYVRICYVHWDLSTTPSLETDYHDFYNKQRKRTQKLLTQLSTFACG